MNNEKNDISFEIESENNVDQQIIMKTVSSITLKIK